MKEPDACRGCNSLVPEKIGGENVYGCIKKKPENFDEEWRRIPEELKSCGAWEKSGQRRVAQVECQAQEETGVLMSASSKECLEYQGEHCRGCVLFSGGKDVYKKMA